LLQRFHTAYQKSLRAQTAWQEAVAADGSAAAQKEAGRCQLWGYAGDDGEARQKFAEGKLDAVEEAAKGYAQKDNLSAAQKLYLQALDLAQFLHQEDRVLRY